MKTSRILVLATAALLAACSAADPVSPPVRPADAAHRATITPTDSTVVSPDPNRSPFMGGTGG